ncbi:glutamine-rich protein 2 [Sorex fumeus]|uniref:glutamine-rich protein 2 n=1 Tax=Sorex fumeus TaxID=62283 RepID=UPI0024ADD1FF|nr:glutamine-rich protein 2 [Sorex fumeus]
MSVARKYSVTLRELADLAIGTPEVGAVNFNALHTLIVALLTHLNLLSVNTDFHAPSPKDSATKLPPEGTFPPEAKKPFLPAHMTRRSITLLENQMKDVDGQLRTLENQVHDIVTHLQNYGIPVPTAAGRAPDTRPRAEEAKSKVTPKTKKEEYVGLGKDQILPAAPEGPSLTLRPQVPEPTKERRDEKTLQDLLERAQDYFSISPQKIIQRVDELEKLIHERDGFLDAMDRKLSVMPMGDEVTMVTWEDLEHAITDGWRLSQVAITPLGEGEETAVEPSKSREAVLSTSGISRHMGMDQLLDYGVTKEDQQRRGRDFIMPAPEGARAQAPAVSQLKKDSDHRKPKQKMMGEQDQVPSLGISPPGRPSMAHMQPYRAFPEDPRLMSLSPEELSRIQATYYQQGLMPMGIAQQRVMPSLGMAEQGLAPQAMSQLGVPPLPASRQQQMFQLPSPEQPDEHVVISPSLVEIAERSQGVAQPGLGIAGLIPSATGINAVQPGWGQPIMVQPSMGQVGVGQPGVGQVGMGQVGVGQVGVGQVGIGQPSLGQVGMGQPGMGQPGVGPVGVGQVGVGQPGMGQVGMGQMGVGQPGVEQVGVGQPGVGQVGVGQVGVGQAGMGQPGMGQVGVGQVGVGQPGMGQVGVGQVGVGQAGMGQPGMGQVGVGQVGMGQVGMGQVGVGQVGMGQMGVGQPGVGQPGVGQVGVGQPGVGQVGVGQPGVGQVGVGQPGVGQVGVGQPGVGQVGVGQPGVGQVGVGQPGVGQPGVGQVGMGQMGVGQPSVGQVGVGQPGVGQMGVGQPGVGQVGVGQVGVGQPGMGQVGLGQVGVGQVGVGQVGMGQMGVGQPGVGQVGVGQPGVGQVGVGQPGVGQVGVGQPGVGQVGVGQPGMGQVGVGQPGMGQPGMGSVGVGQPGVGLVDMAQPVPGQVGVAQPIVGQPGVGQPGVGQPGVGQPGMGQPGVVQPGVGQPGVGQPGMGQSGVGQPSVGQPGMVQPGVGQPSVVQPGVGGPGMVQPGMGQPGVVQPGVGQPGVGQPGMVQPGMGQPGVVQPGVGQPGVGQPGMGQSGMGQSGVGQPSVGQPGMVQPGVGQPGVVQPGVGGVVQPGVGQPGMGQPGMGQPGVGQPGVGQPGMVQPGVGQPSVVQPGVGGVVQPGVGQPGMGQPGMGQPSVGQPGMGQPGMVQPGVGQPGVVQPDVGSVVQPGMGQPGVVQPGMGQPGVGQPGVGQPGVVQPGVGQPGVGQPSVGQPGMGQPGVGQPGVGQPGLGQAGVIESGVGQPGIVPPGMVQPSMVPPGMGQPSMVPPGMGQPGVGQPGVGQPGVEQPDSVPPGMGQPGIAQPRQPGAVPPGMVPPGMVQPGLGQPGAVPPGMVPPGMVQPGLGQPGAVPPDLVLPNLEQLNIWCSRKRVHLGQYSLAPIHMVVFDLLELDLALAHQESLHVSWAHRVPIHLVWAHQERIHVTWAHRVPIHLVWAHQERIHVTWAHRVPIHLVWAHRAPIHVILAHLVSIHLVWAHLVPIHLVWAHRVPILLVWAHRETIHLVWVQQAPIHLVWADRETIHLVLASLVPIHLVSSSWGPIPMAWINKTEELKTPHKSTDSLRRTSQVSADARQERRESLEKLEPNFPIAVETFRTMGEIVGLYTELKEKMKDLDERAGETELDKIQYLLERMVQKSIPADLQEQLKTLKSLSKEIRHEKLKVSKYERLLEGQADVDFDREPEAGNLGLQLGLLRLTVANIENELAELRKSQEVGKETLEQSMSEASLYLQDQLDKLRAIIQNMLASSSTLLSMSMVPQKPKPPEKLAATLAPGKLDPEATCPACSMDLGHQVSMLVKRYEHLQDMVNSLAASRPSKKAKLQSQDEELLGHVQSAILQVQGDCEKLNITTSNLIEDHRQKQKDIAVLYRGMEKLEKEKANREHLEMEIDVKADKSALAATVTRVQFDAATEQLNNMMQELVAKVSGQEQDWQKMVDKILVEMDTKLNRLELDPLKQLLEDRWRAIRHQLKERPPLYQADEASAMRRQLLAHFHCLSCDRPLETTVTGQLIPVTPLGPSMPGHRSIRPYTIFELEQIRQQSRRYPTTATLSRGDVSQRERSVGRLRTMHSKMLMDIEKVQIHFGGSVKTSSQMIRELLQARCLHSPCYRRGADMTNYTYSAIPRHCGGSHTLTYPFRRARAQHPQHLHSTEEVQIAMKHSEVDILGLDGHIYKGRMEMKRLPSIRNRESEASPVPGKSRTKQSRSQPHQTLGELSQLLRPLSAQMTLRGSLAPGRQRKDRPISSEGYLTDPEQVQATPPSHPSDLVPTPLPPLPQVPLSMHPREGPEEPTRGPRSTAEDRAASSDT